MRKRTAFSSGCAISADRPVLRRAGRVALVTRGWVESTLPHRADARCQCRCVRAMPRVRRARCVCLNARHCNAEKHRWGSENGFSAALRTVFGGFVAPPRRRL